MLKETLNLKRIAKPWWGRHSACRGAFALVALAATGTIPVFAHHSLAAAYDDKKPVTLKGPITKIDWTNPHVFIFLDVADTRGNVVNWAVEFPSRIEMKRDGWTQESAQIGEVVTVEGSLARDGSKQANGKLVTLASGKKLNAAPAPFPKLSSAPAKPAPRWPDGHLRLGRLPGEAGYWTSTASSIMEETGANVRINAEGLLANINDAGKVAPLQPWARGLYEYRQKTLLADDPMASCLPPGGPRQFQVPYGIRIIEQPEKKRIFVMSGGGNRNWRLIHLDARAHQPDDVTPTYYGDSVGKWDGDTLVIDTLGFNERFWFTNGGLPHTENLHLTERLSRPDYNTLKYEVTVDDPGAYTRTWKSSWNLRWVPNQDIDEYFCDEYNRDTEHR
ncbi:MAG TPA: DUF6152 family protein [Bryobacteraceae bacterium]|jgi:hypothetical protein|nr:DUF6152 family protein [Bryobacteraceae bacterium]